MRCFSTLITAALLSAMSFVIPAFAQDKVARVGVLAFRGVDAAEAEWKPLTDYLSAQIDGWHFDLVPVTLVSAPEKISAKELDFLITNPGNYVTLAEEYDLSALATRERPLPGKAEGLLHFGTVIFTRKDAGIDTIDDLNGKRLAAVSPSAFGGFQMAWRELDAQNFDLFNDLAAIRFLGFPQDAIVNAVLSRDVDVGVVRSGLIEKMAAEGRISLEDISVLQGNSQLEYPHRITGHLYPEWPFTALPGSDKTLCEEILKALLNTQDPEVATLFNLKNIWSAPLSYEDVRKLVTAYRNRGDPQLAGAATTQQSLLLYATLALALVALAALVISIAIARQRRGAKEPEPVSAIPADPDLASAALRFDTLTRREREVLALVCEGQPNKTIATSLGISPKTVEYHRANLMQKTEAGSSAHLVQLATRLGLDQGFSLGRSSH